MLLKSSAGGKGGAGGGGGQGQRFPKSDVRQDAQPVPAEGLGSIMLAAHNCMQTLAQ